MFNVNGVRVGVIGATVRNDAGAGGRGQHRGPVVPRRGRADQAGVRAAARGAASRCRSSSSTRARCVGANPIDGLPAAPWDGPINGIVDALQDTTVDLVIAGHTHRIANTVVGRIPVVEGVNAGGSYSVAQLMLKDGDVAWTGASTRVAKNIGVAPRADVQAIVDEANAETAPLRNQVIGTRSDRHPARPDAPDRVGDGQPRRRRDARRSTRRPRRRSPTRAACGPDIPSTPPSPPTQPGRRSRTARCSPCCRSATATVIETLTGAQLTAALLNGFKPPCGNSAVATGRFPQVSGLKITFHCNGIVPVVDTSVEGRRPGGTLTPVGPTDTVRFVTNDFMFTGGDGYTAFAQGTDVHADRRPAAQRGDRLHHRQLAGRPGRRGAVRQGVSAA